MKRKLVAATVVVSVGAAWLVTAVAQVKPEILVKQRQAAMTLQGKYFGPLAGMAQGKLPYDANIFQRNAAGRHGRRRAPTGREARPLCVEGRRLRRLPHRDEAERATLRRRARARDPVRYFLWPEHHAASAGRDRSLERAGFHQGDAA